MALKTKLKLNLKNLPLIKKIIFLILLFIIFFNVGSVVWEQKQKYLASNYNEQYKELERVYYNSIYKNKKGTWLPDETLYSYIGGALINGKSPILLNPEVPPLGTYLIGLSTVLFNNQHIIILLFGILDLYLIYLLGKQIYTSSITRIIPVVLFSSEPIFKNQLIYTPLLDIIQLSFLLGTFYFFNKFLLSKNHNFKYALIINILLGLFISTKFFGTGFAVVLSILITLLVYKEFTKIKYFLLTLPISVVILYLNYFKVLVDGYPINRFLGIQKWIFLYNKGHVTQPFTIWPLLFLNKWFVWFGDKSVISDPQWLITWPLITSISIITTIFSFIKKNIKKELVILVSWIVIYLLLMSFIQISARYFIILIPFLYLVSIYGIEQYIIKKIR